MAYGTGGDRLKRAVRMVLLLWWAVLAGGFLFLRSVDPVAEQDREWAMQVAAAAAVPGAPEVAGGSAAGIRAGLRDELGRRVEEREGRAETTIDANNALVQCRARTPTTPWERVGARLLGVDDPGNADVTAEAYRALTAGPDVVTVSDVLTFSSEASAQEAVRRLEAAEFRECVARGMAGDAPAAVASLPVAAEGMLSAVRLTAATPTPEGLLPFVDLVVFQRGRAVAVLGLGGRSLPPRPEQHQPVLDQLAGALSTVPAG